MTIIDEEREELIRASHHTPAEIGCDVCFLLVRLNALREDCAAALGLNDSGNARLNLDSALHDIIYTGEADAIVIKTMRRVVTQLRNLEDLVKYPKLGAK